MKKSTKQRLIYITLFSLILVVALPFILSAKPRAYQLTDVEETADTLTSINVNENVTIHCRAYQPYSGTEVGVGYTCNHYMQWNDSTTAWADIPTSEDIVWVSTNPYQWQLGKVGGDTWQELQVYDVIFTEAGTFNVRCREPSEPCSDSTALISDSWIEVIVEEVAEPSNCWSIITGGIYVPQGCTYYIEGGSTDYIT